MHPPQRWHCAPSGSARTGPDTGSARPGRRPGGARLFAGQGFSRAMLELGLKVLVSYLLGCLTAALILGRLAGGAAIRTAASGNAGGTNALRTQGRWCAARVMFIDVLKGLLPPLVLPSLVWPGIPLDPEVSRTWLTL